MYAVQLRGEYTVTVQSFARGLLLSTPDGRAADLVYRQSSPAP